MKNKILILTLLFHFIAVPETISAAVSSEEEYKSLGCSRYEPGYCDYLFIGLNGTIALIPNAFSAQMGPHLPRWTDPPATDTAARNLLVWQAIEDAALTSDILLYSLISSALWAPLLTEKDYFRGALLGAEAMIYTVALTELLKRTVARQRPYARFGTRPSKGVDDNLSFISGHTSTAFAAATTSALLLSDAHPEWAWLIFPSFYLAAATTGYMRIAADRHYLTDVLAGAAAGTSISLLVYYWRKPWFMAIPTPEGVSFMTGRRF